MDAQTNIQFEPMPEQNNQIVTFNYEGTPISFNRGDAVMVNATEMAKPFGKLPKDFLVNKSTKELIDTLSAVRKIPLTELVVVNQGGNIQGTWMHEDVAMGHYPKLNFQRSNRKAPPQCEGLSLERSCKSFIVLGQ